MINKCHTESFCTNAKSIAITDLKIKQFSIENIPFSPKFGFLRFSMKITNFPFLANQLLFSVLNFYLGLIHM